MSVAVTSPAPTPLARVLHRAAEAIRPDPLLLPSEWAERFYVLDQRSPLPGTWQHPNAPFLVEPMDRLARQDPCERLVLMMGSQLGKTSVMLIAIGHHIHTSPRPVLYVQPTIETAEEHAKERVQPMLDLCEPLRDRVPAVKSRDGGNTLKLKRFPGGFIKFAGANSAASLASTPIGDLFCDEIDRWPSDCDGEGDPVKLADARTTNFRNAKRVRTSTPTEKGLSRIEADYELTDRRQWWVPCPHCNERQVLRWRTDDGERKGEHRIQWPKGQPEKAVYICKHNGCVIREHEKRWMHARGEWRAQDPERAVGGKVRGYHLNTLNSLLFTWEQLAREWEDIGGDPARLKAFVNTRLAETWDNSLDAATKAEGLLGRREPYVVAPRGVVVVTAAIDVQDDRLELQLTGWGAEWESWALDHIVIPGSPAEAHVWASADTHLRRTVTTDDGRTLAVAATCVDTGGHFADRATLFCQGRDRRHVWAIKGATNPASAIWPKKPGKAKDKTPLYLIGVGQAKSDIYARLRRSSAGPGCMHFPERWPSGSECNQAYFEQLTAEKRVLKGGRLVWTKRHEGVRNEALDLWVYCYAALHGLLRLGLRLPRAPPPADVTEREANAKPTRSQPEANANAGQTPSPAPAPPPVAPPARLPPRPPPRRPSVHSRPPRSLW